LILKVAHGSIGQSNAQYSFKISGSMNIYGRWVEDGDSTHLTWKREPSLSEVGALEVK